MNESGFLFDLNRCTGCGACVVACLIENGRDEASGWRRVYTFNDAGLPGVTNFHLSLACSHCTDPPCASTCPALAYERDARTGALLLRQERCIGCIYCSWACPFDAPRFQPAEGVMSKCTWCNHRLLEGLSPACVTSCPTGSLGFGDLVSMPSREAIGFPDSPCGPSIAFRPLRGGAAGPECAAEADVTPATAPPISRGRRFSLRSEWPLAVFTFAAAVLVALAVSRLPGRGEAERPALVAGAACAMALSSLHLGRKRRAWRALLNLRRSWLSREIASFALFSAALAMPLLPGHAHPLWDWIAGASGFCALWAIDRVYDALKPGAPLKLHSAGAFLTGVYLAGFAAELPLVAGLAGALKLGLYAGRHLPERRAAGWKSLPLIAAARIGLPVMGWGLFLAGLAGPLAALLLLGAGEAVDRAEFYCEMECQSPARQMELELSRELAESHVRRQAA